MTERLSIIFFEVTDYKEVNHLLRNFKGIVIVVELIFTVQNMPQSMIFFF